MLNEIKRIIVNDGEGLKIKSNINVPNDNYIPTCIMRLPYPEDCKEYEVRYRQSPNGKYIAGMSSANSMSIFEYDRYGKHKYITISCFIPKSWIGKRFNRYTAILDFHSPND